MMYAHPGQNNSTSLRQTANYVWSTTDVLGQGATGYVFKGREKKSGKEYAIKVFTSLSFMSRSADTRKREFEMLKKVNHQNVVRLCDVEEEATSKQDVIIMELCSAGNLLSMLDDPENLYGLNEEELKRVLSHITAGMKHLHDLEIVHRDLKPGNIMRSFGEDGTPVYKLTDFGAARELADNEQFQSLYGTEEYLHPDIYERAVLRKPQGKKFSATVDLWSLGVTLYHVATGSLPFRPYGGARRNKEVMYKITTEKPSGALSGVQHTERGDIDWSRNLPKTCRLSIGLKNLLTPVLSGILECDPRKIWTFERYFAAVDDILSKRVMDVFTISTAMLHKIYISPEKTLVSFQEQVAELTDIRSSRQLLLFEGAQFDIEAFKPVKDYPKTTPECPFVLLNIDLPDFQAIVIPHTCKPPKVKASLSLENDASLAKVCSSTLFDITKSVQYLLSVQELIRLGVKWFVSFLKNKIMKLQILCGELRSKVHCLRTSLEIFEEHYQRETSLLRVISMTLPSPAEVNELKLFFTQITDKAKSLREIRTSFDHTKEQVRKLDQYVLQEKTPESIFVDEGSRPEDKLHELMRVRSDRSRETYRLFKKHKHAKRLNVAENQVHKFEKQRLSEICEASVKLFTDSSVPACKRLHKASTAWFSDMNEHLSQIQRCESAMMSLLTACTEQDDAVRSLQKIYREKLSLVEKLLKESVVRFMSILKTQPSGRPQAASSLTNANHIEAAPITSLKTKQVSLNANRQKLGEIQKELRVAKNTLQVVRSEVESGSEILRRLGIESLNSINNQQQ